MAERDADSGGGGGGWSIPWPALAAILVAVGGTLYYFSALSSSRPPAAGEAMVLNLGYQDAAARLWQDPFRAVHDHQRSVERPSTQLWRGEGRAALDAGGATTRAAALAVELSQPVREASGPAHDLAEITEQIGQEDAVTVVAVMVPAAPYAELVEQRIRARVAILEALAVSGFEPVDGEHIGYFKLPWLWKRLNTPGTAADRALNKAAKGGRDVESLLIPYEWGQTAEVAMTATMQPKINAQVSPTRKPPRASTGTSATQPVREERTTRVLVLWLAEEAFADLPLSRLADLLDRLGFWSRKSPLTLRIIGPRVSSTLRTMAAELNGISDSTRDILEAARFYSPTATATDQLLLADLASAASVSDQFATKGLSFTRTTTTDRTLCIDLVTELELRGLKSLRAKPRADTGYEQPIIVSGQTVFGANQPDHVAVISEWDTFYGRALPTTFAAAVLGDSVDASHLRDLTVLRSSSPFPPWVHPFVYLRGIDGKALANRERDGSDPPTASPRGGGQYGASKLQAPGEQPEGTNQSDYARRLADQLVELDADLRRRGETGLRAIGLLGTDQYDKLLILRALRDRLRTPLYFTTNLDARYALPSEWDAAHNLIVASPFGLRLHAYFQGNIPPFRDSYQTSLFASTLAALGGAPPRLDERAFAARLAASHSRIFEIGRNGAVDLSLGTERELRPEVFREYPDEQRDKQDVPASVHPPRYDLKAWQWSWPKLCALAAAYSLLLVGARLGVRPATAGIVPVLTSGITFALVAGALIAFLIVLGLAMDPIYGEPLRWTEGISVWPTIAIRFFAAALCLHFILRAIVRTPQNNRDIERDFKLQCLPGEERHPDAPEPPKAGTTRVDKSDHALAQESFGREWRYDGWIVDDPRANPRQVHAQNLWWEYKRRTVPSVKAWRVLVLSAIYILFAVGVIRALGAPDAPARGPTAQRFEMASMILSVIGSILLTFFVLDSTYLNKRFIDELARTDTHWPEGAADQYACGLEAPDLTELLDIRLIAKRTKVVGEIIYYPFIIFILMIVARNPLFDDWDWPPGLVLILTSNLLLAVWGALMLRNSAEGAHSAAIRSLRDRLTEHLARGREAAAKAVEQIISRVRNERQGAFSVLSQYPTVSAILLPSSGIGLWALFEFLARSA